MRVGPFGICLAHQDILFCGHRHRSSDEAGYAGHQDVAASALRRCNAYAHDQARRRDNTIVHSEDSGA